MHLPTSPRSLRSLAMIHIVWLPTSNGFGAHLAIFGRLSKYCAFILASVTDTAAALGNQLDKHVFSPWLAQRDDTASRACVHKFGFQGLLIPTRRTSMFWLDSYRVASEVGCTYIHGGDAPGQGPVCSGCTDLCQPWMCQLIPAPQKLLVGYQQVRKMYKCIYVVSLSMFSD